MASFSPPEQTITLTIDGKEVSVPAGTLIIRAAEQIGVEVPRFCDHPLLDPVGACRQCYVEVEGQRKLFTSCTTTVSEGMIVKTQNTSDVVHDAQVANLEFLLLNHPLDCPICDRGGECPLQDQALAFGPGESRYREPKRTYEKPIALSPLVGLDRERCVLCARCTRFCDLFWGDRFIALFSRGAGEQGAIAGGEEWRDDHSLISFRHFWQAETRRRGIAGPEVVERYPYLAGGHPDKLPGIDVLAELAEDAVVVSTADPFHHGIGYGDPAERAVPPESGGLELARETIEAGIALLGPGDYAGYDAHCVEAKSDARDAGQVFRYLRGELTGKILDLTYTDAAELYESPRPTWVAAPLVEWQRV